MTDEEFNKFVADTERGLSVLQNNIEMLCDDHDKLASEISRVNDANGALIAVCQQLHNRLVSVIGKVRQLN